MLWGGRVKRASPNNAGVALDYAIDTFSASLVDAEEAGDFSHSEKNHSCDLCRCKKTAGVGTEHYGVGYCYNHDQGIRTGKSALISRNMKIAAQQGYPDEPWRYQTDDKYLSKIREDALHAKEFLSLKEEMLLLKSNLQKVVDSWTERGGFTEMYRGVPIEASDETKTTVLTKLTDSVGKLARIHLDVTSEDYVHIEEVKIWLSEFIRIIENAVSEEQFGKIVTEIKEVPQPMTGKRKRARR